VIGRSSTDLTMSSGWRPAASAGEPAATFSMRTWPVGVAVPATNAAVSTATANRKFMMTPAASTMAWAHHGLEVNDPGSPAPRCSIEKSS
jgi:hypothetical protein